MVPDCYLIFFSQPKPRWRLFTCEVCLLDPNLILREAEINGSHMPRFHSTGTRLTVHVLVLVCACVCVMTFPQRDRARFISHKHEPMDPISVKICVFTQQCEEQRYTGGEKETRVIWGYHVMWTLLLKCIWCM